MRSGPERRRPITVVMVDDHPLMRHMLTQMLVGAGMDVVGEAATGEEAVDTVVDLRPDVVVMDLALPGISGIEATTRLAALAPSSRVLILSGSEELVVEAILAGAAGYMCKTTSPDEIISAVRTTSTGESVLSPSIAGQLLDRIRERDIPATASSSHAAHAIRAALTTRELDIFERLAGGTSNQQIGRDLSLSASTVSNHVASILAKLQLENRIQAAVHAVRSGIS